MFKLIRRIIFLGILIALFLVGKNWIALFGIQKGFASATGLGMKIGTVDLGIKDTYFGMKSIKVLNPDGFVDKIMFEAPEIFVDYRLGGLLKKKIHLEEVRLDFSQLVIVKNAQGQINLNALKPKGAQAPDEKSEDKKDSKSGDKPKAPALQIDHLLLKIGKVVYKDYSQGKDPVVKEYPVNVYEKFDDITGAEELAALVIRQALMRTAMANFGNLDIDFLKDSATEAVTQKAMDTVKDKLNSFHQKVFGSE